MVPHSRRRADWPRSSSSSDLPASAALRPASSRRASSFRARRARLETGSSPSRPATTASRCGRAATPPRGTTLSARSAASTLPSPPPPPPSSPRRPSSSTTASAAQTRAAETRRRPSPRERSTSTPCRWPTETRQRSLSRRPSTRPAKSWTRRSRGTAPSSRPRRAPNPTSSPRSTRASAPAASSPSTSSRRSSTPWFSMMPLPPPEPAGAPGAPHSSRDAPSPALAAGGEGSRMRRPLPRDGSRRWSREGAPRLLGRVAQDSWLQSIQYAHEVRSG
mmetsp:Transcript_10008/g.31589  ORF Transcript_10008/g.31589 Transcript_10008/m.31589 type:complete len:277 (+) Transcript_10008:592-1422(+)